MKIKTRLGKIILLAAMLTVSALQGVSANTVSVGITTYITETGEKGYGCTSIGKHYASPTDVSIEPAQSVPGTEETALKLGMGAGGIAALYSSLAQVAESMVPYTSVSFDMYSQSNDVSFAFSYDDANAGNIINSVAISDYAKDAVSYLAGAGIINGYDNGNFAPTDNATRAESAVLIYALERRITQ